MRDFCAETYRRLCVSLVDAGYQSLTLTDYFLSGGLPLQAQRVILRHDLDRFPRMAIPLATIERDLGLRATYYVRVPSTCDPSVIREVTGLGHELGFHYENLAKTRGDVALAQRSFADDLARLRRYCSIRTACMHGSPASRSDNRDLWPFLSREDLGLLGEAYLDVDFSTILYYSDTGRTWAAGRFNMRDHIPAGRSRIAGAPMVRTTEELITLIRKERRNLYLVAHPERWPVSPGGWVLAGSKDVVFNLAKLLLRTLNAVRDRKAGVADV